MKTVFAILFSIVTTINAWAAQEPRSTMPQAAYVTPQEMREWQAQGKKFTYVDVREPSEFAMGHLEGAINVKYLDVEKAAKDFDREQPYVFYCTYSAWRAPYGANTMADLGFPNAYILQGGIAAWHSGGQVIYSSDPATDGKIAPYPEGLAKILYHPQDRTYPNKIHLTRKQLADFNGLDGRPAYVAVKGTVYDLTQSRLWRGGIHAPSKGEALAGQDLTELLEKSPHGDKHLKDFPVVGWLVN